MSPFVLPKKRKHTCYRPLGRNYGVGSIWLCPGCGSYWLLVSIDDIPVDKRWQLLTKSEAERLIAEAEAGASE